MFASKFICIGFATFFLTNFTALAIADTPLTGAQLEAYRLLAKMSVLERQSVLKRFMGNSAREVRNPRIWNAQELQSPPPANSSGTKTLPKGCEGFVPLLRQDWKDIDFTSCPQDVAKAIGA
jgi:hypothetical protein